MKYNKQKDNGFTLVELLIVLVVISILALVVVAVKPKVIAQLDTYKVNNAIDIMVSQSSVWRGSKYNYNGISVKGMCEQQLLPFEVCGASNDGSGANPFGGDYEIKTSNAYGNQHINITVSKINSNSLGSIENSMLSRSIESCSSIKGCGSFGKVQSSGRDGKTTSIDIDV